MSNIVAVSRALPDYDKGKPGGLVVAMKLQPGDVWVGIADDVKSPWAGLLTKHDIRGGVDHVSFPQTKHFRAFYGEVSNSFLWPFMHGDIENSRIPTNEELEAYSYVNKLAAHHAITQAGEDSAFWVHDYQLLETPYYLHKMTTQRGEPERRIGFFLHIPFPSQTDFEQLGDNRSIAEDRFKRLLYAKLLGFQTPGDLENFKAFAPHVGAEIGKNNTIRFEGRTVELGVFPASIDPKFFTDFDYRSDRRNSVVEDLLNKVGNRKFILRVERADPEKATLEGILAFERFLEMHPAMADKVAMMVIAPRNRIGVSLYDACFEKICSEVSRVNARFGQDGLEPIIFQGTNLKRETELPHVMREAAVAEVTSKRDGMNLVAKEFISAQNVNNPGVLVLAPLVGAAHDLGRKVDQNGKLGYGAHVVDPLNIDASADMIRVSLNLPKDTTGMSMEDVNMAWNEKRFLRQRQNDFDYMMASINNWTDESFRTSFKTALGVLDTVTTLDSLPARQAQSRFLHPS